MVTVTRVGLRVKAEGMLVFSLLGGKSLENEYISSING